MKEEVLYKTRESFITVFSWKKFLTGLLIIGFLVLSIIIDFKKDVKTILIWVSIGLIFAFIIYILICMWLKSLHRIWVYEDHIYEREGLLNVRETNAPIEKISAITIETPFFGSIFNYGTLYFDSVGKIDINSHDIKNAKKLKRIIEELMLNDEDEEVTTK